MEHKQTFLDGVRFKETRRAVMGLHQAIQEKMYDGMTAEDYQRMHIKSRIESSIKDKMKARDQQKIEMAKLRSARMLKLAELQGIQTATGAARISAVPDGAVETTGGGVSTAQLLAGVGAQNSFAVKKGRQTIADGAAGAVVRETTPRSLRP